MVPQLSNAYEFAQVGTRCPVPCRHGSNSPNNFKPNNGVIFVILRLCSDLRKVVLLSYVDFITFLLNLEPVFLFFFLIYELTDG